MAYRCFNCDKKNWAGRRSQHHKGVAGGSWKHKAQKSNKLFMVNLHMVRFMEDGTMKREKLCTDCISKFRKDGKITTGMTPAVAKIASPVPQKIAMQA